MYIRNEAEFKAAAGAGGEIRLAPGVLRLTSPVNIAPGTHIYGENTILTPKEQIYPEWKPFSGKILSAEIGAGRCIDALYHNGVKLILARYPDYRPGQVLGGFSADALDRAPLWKNPAGGHVCALHFSEWGSNHYEITGKDDRGNLQLRWVGDNNRGSAMHAVKRMVENIFEELDSPGEWFYDTQAGILYHWPNGDTDGIWEVSGSECLLKISGSDVKISDLCIEATARTVFTGEYERPLRGDWGIVRQAAIELTNADNVVIQNCRFSDIGGNAILFSGKNANCRVLNCDFNGIGATGILVAGLTKAVRDPSCYDGNNHKTRISDFIPGPASDDYPRDIEISDCWFRDIGTVEKQTAAVCLSICERVSVRRCTIHHCSRAGLNISSGCFGGHVIEDNDLFDCVTETADHGPINAWGRDRYWSVPQHDALGYYGREKRPFALLDARSVSVIRHNRITANHAFGIDIDDGASNYDIFNNLCVGVGIKLRDGFDRRVHNNMLIGAGFELHMSFAQNNDLIYSNIAVFRRAYNELCINEGCTTLRNNNLYWNPNGRVAAIPDDEFASREEDPLFIDYNNGDYRLRADSPALKMGFAPFPVGDGDFGRPDADKPEKIVETVLSEDAPLLRYYDVVFSDAESEGVRSAAGLPDNNGAFVVDRDVLGLFCKLGLPIGIGDVIRRVGGTVIRHASDFPIAFEKIQLGVLTPIEIYRSQKPLLLNFIKDTDDFRSIGEVTEIEWRERKEKEGSLS